MVLLHKLRTMPPKQLTINIKENGFADLYYIKLKVCWHFPLKFSQNICYQESVDFRKTIFPRFFFSSAYLNHLQRKPVCLNFSFGTNFFLLCSGIMMQWGNIIVGIKFQELELKMHKWAITKKSNFLTENINFSTSLLIFRLNTVFKKQTKRSLPIHTHNH